MERCELSRGRDGGRIGSDVCEGMGGGSLLGRIGADSSGKSEKFSSIMTTKDDCTIETCSSHQVSRWKAHMFESTAFATSCGRHPYSSMSGRQHAAIPEARDSVSVGSGNVYMRSAKALYSVPNWTLVAWSVGLCQGQLGEHMHKVTSAWSSTC